MNRQLELTPSRYLAAMLLMAHGLFLAALPQLALPIWSKLALAGLVLCSMFYYLRRDAWLRAPDSCVGMRLQGDEVELLLRDGRRVPGRLLHDTLVTPWLTVLNLKLAGQHAVRSTVILPDSLAADAFRELRVWLKWGAQAVR